MEPRNTIIIGTGPAGLTAAIYTARANLSPLVVEGQDAGGQLMITTDVENFPGFEKGIMGPDLMAKLREQAARFGTDFISGDVQSVDLSSRPFKLQTSDGELSAKTIIIATGAKARWLGLENEQRLIGKGVSACATCDGFFFRDQEIAVVGGGDSAMEEATFLTKFASKVRIIHRRDSLRASKIMQDRAMANEKISVEWNSVVEDVLDDGSGELRGVVLRDVNTNETRRLDVTGLFLAIGHVPNTAIFKGQIELDDAGYVILHGGTRTSVEGVFAAGDVADHTYRQAITAAGTGCMAAIDAERSLEG
jgi:thioredoxin reductase (NADPH)